LEKIDVPTAVLAAVSPRSLLLLTDLASLLFYCFTGVLNAVLDIAEAPKLLLSLLSPYVL